MERAPDEIELSSVEDGDGVVDLGAVVAQAAVPVPVIAPGPRRWSLEDVSAEATREGEVEEVRLRFRCDPVRTVVVASEPPARAAADPRGLARRVATGLAFEAWRRLATPGSGPFRALGDRDLVRVRDRAGAAWSSFVVPSSPAQAPVRLLVGRSGCPEDGVVVAASGIAFEELQALAEGMAPCTEADVARLRVEHRRRLAQRWWDAPRTPWRPDERASALRSG